MTLSVEDQGIMPKLSQPSSSIEKIGAKSEEPLDFLEPKIFPERYEFNQTVRSKGDTRQTTKSLAVSMSQRLNTGGDMIQRLIRDN
jgi:hypothetical protein